MQIWDQSWRYFLFLLFVLLRNLLEQFTRIANLYFLLISAMMLLGTYSSFFDSPMTPWSTLYVLIIVIAISITRSGIEDYRRHVADYEINSRLVHKFDPKTKTIVDVPSRQLRVGDIIRVDMGEEIPADLLLITSSNELDGVAYMETSNIDGESNLKLKTGAAASDGKLIFHSFSGLKEYVLVYYFCF